MAVPTDPTEGAHLPSSPASPTPSAPDEGQGRGEGTDDSDGYESGYDYQPDGGQWV